jgi:transposase-like protein
MSTTKQRDPHKERFWRRIVQQWRKSGLSVRDFCRQRDLPKPRFYAWRRTLQQRDAEAARFIPVRVVPQVMTQPVTDAGRLSTGLELILGSGQRLSVGPAFDDDTLRRLLTILEEGRPCS